MSEKIDISKEDTSDLTDSEKEIHKLLHEFFKGETVVIPKATLWLTTPNPMLGGVTPGYMISSGRTEKLLKAMKEMMAGNIA